MEGPGAARRDDCEAAPSVVGGKTSASAPGESLLSDIGRGRIAQFGCPHCGGDDIRPWGKASGKPRYRCVGCGRTFNPLTGTPLAGLHYPDRWRDQARALISGETIAQAAERCGVDYTTAFRWRHRFLEALNRDRPASLSGIVEADETFILESFKGKRRGLPRAARKLGRQGQQAGPVV
jgi:transposase-like protein